MLKRDEAPSLKGSFINHVDMEEGRVVSQMFILIHKSYFGNWSTKGGGIKCLNNGPNGL